MYIALHGYHDQLFHDSLLRQAQAGVHEYANILRLKQTTRRQILSCPHISKGTAWRNEGDPDAFLSKFYAQIACECAEAGFGNSIRRYKRIWFVSCC